MGVYDSVMFFVTFVEPWWLVFFAIILLTISFTILDSEFLLTISGGILLWSLVLFISPSPLASLIALPVCLLLSYFLQVKFYRSISVGKVPFERTPTDSIGTSGILRVVADDNAASSYYDKKYKSDISQEKVPESYETKIYRVLLSDGGSHDALPDFDGGKTGDRVKVTGFHNGLALVTRD